MAHVVRDHEAGFRAHALPAQMLLRIAKETDHGPGEREIVQQVAPDRRVFRGTGRITSAGFGRSGDDADRPAPHPAGAKLQVAVEPVVELTPRRFCDQLVDALDGPNRQTGGKKRRDILRGAGHDLSGLGGSLDLGENGHGFGKIRGRIRRARGPRRGEVYSGARPRPRQMNPRRNQTTERSRD